MYFEFGNKNHHGGVNDSSNGKTVIIVHNCSQFSHVACLDLYLAKVPWTDIDNDNLFYLSLLPFTPLRERSWYFSDPFSSKALTQEHDYRSWEFYQPQSEGHWHYHLIMMLEFQVSYRREQDSSPLML